MQVQAGDWVQTESGEVGYVVHTFHLSAFVRLEEDADDASLKAFLVSQLTRIDPPGQQPTFHAPRKGDVRDDN